MPVLRLQDLAEVSHFEAQYTIPVESLLDEEVVPRSPSFDVEPRSVLKQLLKEMRNSLIATAAVPASNTSILTPVPTKRHRARPPSVG